MTIRRSDRRPKDLPLLVQVAEEDGDVGVQARAVGAVERMVDLKFGYDAEQVGARAGRGDQEDGRCGPDDRGPSAIGPGPERRRAVTRSGDAGASQGEGQQKGFSSQGCARQTGGGP